MKHVRLFLFLFAIMLAGSTALFGQVGPPPGDGPPPDGQDDRRPNLLAELGLSPEQVQQIRRMNQERRPQMMRAQRRMREAMRDLDMAIYADTFSDADYQARLKEFQAAEADISRLRFDGELSVRKVLTPEQLVKFRDIRRKFAEMRDADRQKRRDGRGRPDGPGHPPLRDGAPNRPIN